jgi:glycine cleavage system H protein
MSPTTHHIIPEGEGNCIWMDAGVVDYKLCNCHFKCDECPFDAQIRTRTSAQHWNEEQNVRAQSVPQAAAVGSSASADAHFTTTLQNILGSVDQQSLPDDRVYTSNHTWAKADGTGLYVLGIDHFIGTMLAAAHSVAFSVPPTHIKANEPYAWIVANGETLAVCSPVAGTIVSNNPALVEHSSVIHTDPYGAGWIATIEPDDGDAAQALHSSNEAAELLKNDRKRYERAILSEAERMPSHSSSTMYDGGIVLENFEAIFGTKKYYEILERFLRP